MTHLAVYSDTDSTTILAEYDDITEIGKVLAAEGVRFLRVDASRPLADGAGQDDVLEAYADLVKVNKEQHSYQAADVVRLPKGAPDTEPMRRKFLSEHIHAEDEARLFVEGSGCFFLHLEGKVVRAVLERGDYISVPAGTRHWFDMGADPYFAAIRFFTNPEGWVAQFTGDAISERYPLFQS